MDFIQKITSEGGELYLVGGTIRDRHYNKYFGTNISPKDYDLLVCKLDLDKLEQILIEFGNVKEVGKAFGIITFRPNDSRVIGHDFDIALPRKEKSTGPGYRDFEIVSDPFIAIEEDLQRRDITVNAIAYRLYDINEMLSQIINDEHVVDLFDGRDDIKNKIIRSVGDPYKRLLEDPTRIMRALRQSAQFNMRLYDDLRQAIIQHSDLLKIIINSSPVRISEELTRLLLTADCGNVLEFMFNETNLFNLMDINLDRDQINDIVQIFKNDTVKYHDNIRIKFSILLKYSDIKKWVKKYELSAAPHYPKEGIKFLLMSQEGINMLENMETDFNEYHNLTNKLDETAMKEKEELLVISMNKFIQIVDKNRDQIINDYLSLCLYNNSYNAHIPEIIKKCTDIVRTTAEVKLGGNILQEKYGLKGKDIGKAKQWLFDEITNQKVTNEINQLEHHLKACYIDTILVSGK